LIHPAQDRDRHGNVDRGRLSDGTGSVRGVPYRQLGMNRVNDKKREGVAPAEGAMVPDEVYDRATPRWEAYYRKTRSTIRFPRYYRRDVNW
jgi:hypothetical protein